MSDADDAIRNAFEQLAQQDPPVDPTGVADAVRAAAGAPAVGGGGLGRLFRPWTAGLAVAGLVAGGATGATGVLRSDPTAVTVALDRVAYARCPGGEATGAFHRGDRVLAVVRSDDGAWLGVRSPVDVARLAWVEKRFITSDGSTSELPVDDCEPHGVVEVAGVIAAEPPTTLAVTDSVPVGTSTTVPGATTTAPSGPGTTAGRGVVTTHPVVGTSPPATSPPTPGTTAAPGDTTAPVIGAISSTHSSLRASTYCGNNFWQAGIATVVTDNVGVATVTLSWSVNGAARNDEAGVSSKAMATQANNYSATIGKFPGPNATATAQLLLTVTARDAAGNQSTRTLTTVTLTDCSFG